MTRIIAGDAGGLRLTVPTSGTRPTSDRVRESLFGALESADAVHGARVLDLYAGSGALGLEALSRGAASAELVESARAAAGVAGRNARAVSSATGRTATVHTAAVIAFLRRGHGMFDLVFSDPPYDLDDTAMTADLIALAPLLSPDAVVVVERAARSTRPDFEAAGLEQAREKRYGDTAVWWAQPAAESQSR
ncbi:16S rRNA (guanine(966)-N(2))-methyltransferase RsmD [Microbacterium sp. NPDC055903]